MNYLNFFKDRKGEIVIWQKPNYPLWLALFIWIIELIIPGNNLSLVLAFSITLVYWSYLEITKGDSQFRKLLGIIVFVYQLFKVTSYFL